MIDPIAIRSEFPIFQHQPALVYLDNAATTQKPHSVIEAERYFYEHQNANVHRGIYPLAAAATAVYESTREKVRSFLNARKSSEIIFTSGTTAGINLVAQSFASQQVMEGDAIVISAMEHHSNLIPWQQICFQKKAKLLVIPMNKAGELGLDFFEKILSEKVKFVAINHISNSLGTINPIEKIIAISHQKNIPVLVDAAQSVASQTIDVQSLDVDFLVFSGHKIFGPTGTGILYGKQKWLEQMPPWQFGGEMILDVTFEKTEFAKPPQKFEAGTPNIAGVAALGAAIDFVEKIGSENIAQHNNHLLKYAMERLRDIPGLEVFGQAKEKTSIISFTLKNIHPHDLATILGEQGVCVRAGHHCTQPVMDFYEIPGTVRASFCIFNTAGDVDKLIDGLLQAQWIFNSFKG